MHSFTYGERVSKHTNQAARLLLQIIDKKQTNLCVSVDVTKKESILAIVDAVGPSVCLIKASTQLFINPLRALMLLLRQDSY